MNAERRQFALWYRECLPHPWRVLAKGTEAECTRAADREMEAGRRGDYYMAPLGQDPNRTRLYH